MSRNNTKYLLKSEASKEHLEKSILQANSFKEKQKFRLQIRKNRDELLSLVFEVKTDWLRISYLDKHNAMLENKLKESVKNGS